MRGTGRRTLVGGLGLLAVLALLVTGCSVGPSHRPPVAVRGSAMASPPPDASAATDPDALPPLLPQRPRLQGRDYTDCTADVLQAVAAAGFALPPGRALKAGCGRLDVDTDPLQRSLGTSRLEVIRVGAADAPDSRPPLVVVGDSATGGSARVAVQLATAVSADVLHAFQLIGLDRRGSGADLLDCGPTETRALVVDAEGTVGTQATDPAALDSLLEQARGIVSECYLQLDAALGSVRSAATADDLERLRLELRINRLNVLGIGDGASAAAVWAAAHPEAVGRVVLDSPVDLVTDEPDRSEARAAAAEAAFTAFATACLSWGSCPLGGDPRAAVTGLLTALQDRPLAGADGERLTPGIALTAIRSGLAEPARWPALAAGLATAGSGDPAGLFPFIAPVLGDRGSFDGELATSCNDAGRRFTPIEAGQLAERWAAQYPMFGAAAARRLLTCAPWPATRSTSTVAALPATAPPLLVVGTAANPRGGQAEARKVADTLGRSRYIGWQGAGAGAYPRSSCITSLVDKMLVGGALPQANTVCPA